MTLTYLDTECVRYPPNHHHCHNSYWLLGAIFFTILSITDVWREPGYTSNCAS